MPNNWARDFKTWRTEWREKAGAQQRKVKERLCRWDTEKEPSVVGEPTEPTEDCGAPKGSGIPPGKTPEEDWMKWNTSWLKVCQAHGAPTAITEDWYDGHRGTYLTADRALKIWMSSDGQRFKFTPVHESEDPDAIPDPDLWAPPVKSVLKGRFMKREYRVLYKWKTKQGGKGNNNTNEIVAIEPVDVNAQNLEWDTDRDSMRQFLVMANDQGSGKHSILFEPWDYITHEKTDDPAHSQFYLTKTPMLKYTFWMGYTFWTILTVLLVGMYFWKG